MGRVFVRKLEGRYYSCKFCKTHLVHADHIISRAFQSRRGKAYLVSSVVNVTYGPHEERMMLSGMHTVADVYCISCGQIIGWKYEASPDETQKYKEGKYVLERARMVDNSDTEFSIDTHPGTSDDGEDSEIPA